MRPALVFPTGSWNREELAGEVGAWTRWLAFAKLPVGGRVGVLAWDRPETIALFHACAAVGLTLVPFNARLTRRELAPLVDRARATLVFADDALLDRIEGARPFPKLTRSAPAVRAIADEVPLAALFTSGTSGMPRLIELTHGNFRASA